MTGVVLGKVLNKKLEKGTYGDYYVFDIRTYGEEGIVGDSKMSCFNKSGADKEAEQIYRVHTKQVLSREGDKTYHNITGFEIASAEEKMRVAAWDDAEKAKPTDTDSANTQFIPALWGMIYNKAVDVSIAKYHKGEVNMLTEAVLDAEFETMWRFAMKKRKEKGG